MWMTSLTSMTEIPPPRKEFVLRQMWYSTTVIGPQNEEPEHPPDAHSAVLFRVYFNNVDPVCKILHRPTVDTYFSNVAALFEPSTRRFKFRSLEAVTFAVYFAAMNSMSVKECLTYLGEDKEELSARYKRSTESLLEQADFMNAMEITTLQALTIYIVSVSQTNTLSGPISVFAA